MKINANVDFPPNREDRAIPEWIQLKSHISRVLSSMSDAVGLLRLTDEILQVYLMFPEIE